MRVFGARLRTVLSRSVEKSRSPLRGDRRYRTGAEAAMATTMLVTSFVAQDLVALAPALVIVLGADVGTDGADGAYSHLRCILAVTVALFLSA
ncbi:hypothetical protein O5282_05595 [Escherichia coli]|nr:hypothetical protein [Escherichia coli]